MTLPLKYPFTVMEAKTADQVPQGKHWRYEPKWDGFRCLVFKDGKRVRLQSKGKKELTRYFPDLVERFRNVKCECFVLDGEIVIAVDGRTSFDALLQRIHPAASRIAKLSLDTPAMFIAFDLLVDDKGRKITHAPLDERRHKLTAFTKRFFKHQSLRISPQTKSYSQAKKWLDKFRGALDGIMAKNGIAEYNVTDRQSLIKIKATRTADCVIGGFRYASKGRVVGSLLLGLYDKDGLLHHVGFTSAIPDKAQATALLQKLRGGEGFSGRAPGGPSRWSTERSAKWVKVRPTTVIEVQYDHFSEGRFRHGTKFLRWRPDKSARSCKMEQVEQEARSPLLLTTPLRELVS